jgi:hypothetical protein
MEDLLIERSADPGMMCLERVEQRFDSRNDLMFFCQQQHAHHSGIANAFIASSTPPPQLVDEQPIGFSLQDKGDCFCFTCVKPPS